MFEGCGMKRLPKLRDFRDIEAKWQRFWEEKEIYRFDWEDTSRPTYSIDTPPPYPSGEFHMGNVLNWTYIDVVARYKRMRGYNVYFPQGWDCHGLPTEVAVEKELGVPRSEVPPSEFRRMCERLVEKYIQVMKNAIKRLGCSIDWTAEYRTMDPSYWRKTQLSFIILYKKGLIYRGVHPTNWCPRCETAIADAEVEHVERAGKLNYIRFPLEGGGHVTIATTRPELIPACVAVAVHPEDDRYRELVGRRVLTPIFGKPVEIVADRSVDPEFGTGVVMICTFGDKADVEFVMRRGLPIVKCVDEKGRMTEAAGRYAGLTVEEARRRIVEDLREQRLLERVETIEQDVGVCWRCKTPVEILVKRQWFMRILDLTDRVVEETMKVRWVPDHMKWRLIDWARSLTWDWVISRQRVFATPIPVWYCKKCGEVILASEDEIPVDPKTTPPKVGRCPRCGGTEFEPERDVLDTWFDSSITCAVHAGWPDRQDWRRLFPADLHPSGADIIRTWAYYLMVRHLALFDEPPYKTVLINGIVLGADGRKMSKSLGNYVPASEVFARYCTDAIRQWAAGGGATGFDIPFRWEDVEHGRRFLIKLWNACRFAGIQLEDYDPESGRPRLRLLDRWLLSKLERLTAEVTEALENFRFNVALNAVREFVWHVLCDHYIEAVKHRLYSPEKYGVESRRAAQYTLYTAMYRILQLLAPFCPHITEEIYQNLYADHVGAPSIHLTEWPKVDETLIDPEAERMGDVVVHVIASIRAEKARRRIPLSSPVAGVVVYDRDGKWLDVLRECVEDIAGTIKAEKVFVEAGEGGEAEVQGYEELSVTVKA